MTADNINLLLLLQLKSKFVYKNFSTQTYIISNNFTEIVDSHAHIFFKTYLLVFNSHNFIKLYLLLIVYIHKKTINKITISNTQNIS